MSLALATEALESAREGSEKVETQSTDNYVK